MDRRKIIDSLLSSWAKTIVDETMQSANNPNAEYSIHPKEYDMFEMNNITVPLDSGEIIYRYNNEGFRSDNISDENKILFLGCSEGEGLGGTLDQSWPKQVFDSIKHLYGAEKFYNLSVDNFGYQKILANCFAYIEKYGNPQAIVILFPETSRTVSWDPERSEYTVKWSNTNNIETKEEESHIMDSLINFIQSMHMFEHFCKTNNIDLFWSVWDWNQNLILTELKVFNNFITIDYGIYVRTPLVEKIIKRDGHQGEYHHQTWSSNISRHIIEKVKYEPYIV
jgi:hypothetical protein